MCGARTRRVSSLIEFCWITPNTERKYLCKSVISPLRSINSKPEKSLLQKFFGVSAESCVWRALCIEALLVVYIRRVYQKTFRWCAMYWNIRLIGDCPWIKGVQADCFIIESLNVRLARVALRARLRKTRKRHQRSVPPLNAKNQQQFHLNIRSLMFTLQLRFRMIHSGQQRQLCGLEFWKKKRSEGFSSPLALRDQLRLTGEETTADRTTTVTTNVSAWSRCAPMHARPSINKHKRTGFVSFHHGHLESVSRSLSIVMKHIHPDIIIIWYPVESSFCLLCAS